MKKLIAIILALICILGLVGCSNSMNHIIKTKPNVTGIVQEVHDDYIIMYSDSAKGYPNGSRWQISLNVENKDSYTTLTVGDEIVVYHNGQVMETEPLKVGKVFAITLKTPADRTQNEGDPTADEPQPGGNVVDDWGLNVSAIDITPSGLKLVIVNSINNPTAFGYGSYYWLEQYIDNEWTKVEYAPQEHDVGWTTELYMLKHNDTTTIGIDWEWLYGELPDGHYRVGKNIDNFIKSKKGETRAYYAEFIIGNDDRTHGGTPADEAFDITVSYANWGDLTEIYAKALNTEKMAISSVMHLPIYKFNTLEELDQFKNDIKDTLSIDQRYDEIPSFNESTAKYDENFFAENTLMLVYVESGSGSDRYGVDSVYHADGNFRIHIKQTNRPEIGTCDMAGWFITVAVPDSMVADCIVFDAELQWSNY